jgi:protein-L-isoaspartate(D-aspartate) O-methyltransferase
MHARPEAGIARSAGVIDAMKNIDRKFYVPHGTRPYEDAPQGIGHNVTISAPHMHAMCLEALSAQLTPGARALDVGSGTGYLTVCT